MKRILVVLFLLLLAIPVLASGCGGDGEEPSPPGAAELPEGFPEDFPLWDKATVSVAAEVPESGQIQRYVLALESEESSVAALAYYERALAQEPWQVEDVLEIPAEDMVPASPEPSPVVTFEPLAPVETIIILFSRRDESRLGTVAIQEQQTNGHKTTIALSLTVLR